MKFYLVDDPFERLPTKSMKLKLQASETDIMKNVQATLITLFFFLVILFTVNPAMAAETGERIGGEAESFSRDSFSNQAPKTRTIIRSPATGSYLNYYTPRPNIFLTAPPPFYYHSSPWLSPLGWGVGGYDYVQPGGSGGFFHMFPFSTFGWTWRWNM